MRIKHVTWGAYDGSVEVRPATVTYHDGSYKTLSTWPELASLQASIKAQNEAAQRDPSINSVERHQFDMTMEEWAEKHTKPEDWRNVTHREMTIPLQPGSRYRILYERVSEMGYGMMVDDSMISVGLDPYTEHAQETAQAIVERFCEYLSFRQIEVIVQALQDELQRQKDSMFEIELKHKLQRGE